MGTAGIGKTPVGGIGQHRRGGRLGGRIDRVSALAVLGRRLRSALLMLLAATAVLSFFLGDSTQAVIIGVILVASVGLGFVNEYRAERTAARLHSSVRHTAAVRRDGRFATVDVGTLVPGAVIRLALGEVVPADVRLIETSDTRQLDRSGALEPLESTSRWIAGETVETYPTGL
jgi:Mg2+-importing ATPase